MKNCLYKKLLAGFLAFTLFSTSPIQSFAMGIESGSADNSENSIEQVEPDVDTAENSSADEEKKESVEQEDAVVSEPEEKSSNGELEDKPKAKESESISEKQENEIIRVVEPEESAETLRQLTYRII